MRLLYSVYVQSLIYFGCHVFDNVNYSVKKNIIANCEKTCWCLQRCLTTTRPFRMERGPGEYILMMINYNVGMG